jgi:hypothetical protein
VQQFRLRCSAFDDDKAIWIDKGGIELGAAGAVVLAEKIVRASGRDRFKEVGQSGKAGSRCGTGCSLVVERTIFQKRELGAVIRELIHLAMIELLRTDNARRGK